MLVQHNQHREQASREPMTTSAMASAGCAKQARSFQLTPMGWEQSHPKAETVGDHSLSPCPLCDLEAHLKHLINPRLE